MYAVLSILAVAVLGGLTALALKNRDGFLRVALPLYWASLLTLLGLAGEALGTRSAVKAMQPFIAPERSAEAQAVIATLGTPWWAMLVVLAFATYLFILLFLPMIVGTHKKVRCSTNAGGGGK